MAETLLAELPDGTRMKSGVGIAMLTRLRQIACGLDTLSENVVDSYEARRDVEDPRALGPRRHYVASAGTRRRCVSLQTRLAGLGIEACLIDGDVPAKERTQIIRDFQNGRTAS
jgi:hypothetical protein